MDEVIKENAEVPNIVIGFNAKSENLLLSFHNWWRPTSFKK